MAPSAKKRPDIVTVIAIYHLFEAAMFLMGLLVLAVLAVVILTGARGEPGTLVPVALAAVGGMFLFALAAANVAVGWGLLTLRNWARWGAIFLSVLRLPNIPIGTAIGGLIIYFLLQDEAVAAFAAD
ncbi:MAG: hypothetical protein GX657_08945 [Chloroflexi bacterium]|jgi:hypothetical protein|nr:hypothetical protein [Chloroflexota bacterium]